MFKGILKISFTMYIVIKTHVFCVKTIKFVFFNVSCYIIIYVKTNMYNISDENTNTKRIALSLLYKLYYTKCIF